MAQKFMPQPDAFTCALDQPGDIRQHETVAKPALDHAQIWRKRRKMVIGDFRVGIRHHGKQCRFADIREPNQPYVRNQLQFENHVIFLCRTASFRIARGLSCRRGKMLVAFAALAAVYQYFPFPVMRNIRHNLTAFGFADNRTDRHLYHNVLTVLAEAVALAAVAAVHGLKHTFIPEIHQRTHAFVADEHNVAALAAVAAVRSAVRNIFCAVKRNHAVAAVAALYMDFHPVYKHFLTSF